MDITYVIIENRLASVQTNVPQTFGQVFKRGAVPSGTYVQLAPPTGAALPCQMDVKTRYNDGSVKHAILSAIIPSIGAQASVKYTIATTASAPTGTAAVPADFPGLNAVVTINDTGTDITGPTAGTGYTANAAARLAAGTYIKNLEGPIVSEWILRVPFVSNGGVEHPDLHARIHIRAYKGQSRARVSFCIENCWAKPKATMPTTVGGTPWDTVSVDPKIYSFALSVAGTIVERRTKNGYLRARLEANGNGTYHGNSTYVPNDSTTYTATVVIDGVPKAISVVGSAIQTYGQLYSAITSQLGGLGVCDIDEDNLGLRIKSNSTGANSTVSVNYGTLFPALKHLTPYRPMRGDEFLHYPATRWRKVFWWGSEPNLHLRHDMRYFIDTGALPNYPLTLTGNPDAIAANLNTMAKNGDIGQNGMTKAFMGDTGYAPGIGILPEWTATYIVNQGFDAKSIMLQMADLQGSWPAHVREYDTDLPINFSKWPYATTSPNASDSRNDATGLNEKLPSAPWPSHLPVNANKADIAHHPDFPFVPYLVTGDYHHLESLLLYFTVTQLWMNAHYSYRNGGKCLWKGEGQIRGQAWMMRTAAHTRYALPDNHPNKVNVEYIAQQNVSWYNASYVASDGPYRTIFGDYAGGIIYTRTNSKDSAAPWQEDFATMAVGRSVEMGYTEFLPLLKYKSLQVKGRLTSGQSFCYQLATNYNLRYRDTSTSPLYSSWAEVYQKTFGTNITSQACGSAGMAAVLNGLENTNFPPGSMSGYPDAIGGFPSNLQPAVAYCATYNMPSGRDAWLVFDNRSVKPDYNYGPQWAIEPRTLPDQPLLQLFRAGPNGLGGAISDAISDGGVFDPVQLSEATTGDKEYRCDYVFNSSTTQTIKDAVFYLSANTPSSYTEIKAGLGTSPKNGVEQVVANEGTAPVGVTFALADTKAAGIALGDIGPQEWRAIWQERTVLPGAIAKSSDPFTRTVEGSAV